MLQYILECIAFQLVFLIIYDFFLKRETFFQWNRAYLIGSYVLSLVLPWTKIEALKNAVPQQYYKYPDYLWGTDDVPAVVSGNNTSTIEWEYVLFFGGMFIATLLFGYKMMQLYKLRKNGEVHFLKDFTKIIISNSNAAFSFFRSIFIGDRILKNDQENIIQHELVHIRQRHSYDLLFFEMMRIIGWFNPLAYVYQNRVAELHEFIADAHVAKNNKKEQYQQLLSQVFQTENISFINQFFKSSLIKKRIVMLQRAKSKRIFQLKYLMMVPIVMAMLFYSSCENEIGADGIETISVNDIENLTEEEHSTIATKVIDNSVRGMDWTLKVKDENSTITFSNGSEGSFISGPGGIPIKAKMHIESKVLDEDFSFFDGLKGIQVLLSENYTSLNPEMDYGVLTKERQQLLERKNENEPIIQELDKKLEVLKQQILTKNPGTVPFGWVDEVPIFPGCENSDDSRACFQTMMQKHISKNFRYPQEAQEQGIQGRVNIMFTMSEEGNIDNIRKRGPHRLLEDEAVRIISKLPKMTPGKYEGKAVSVPFSIPITFKLQHTPHDGTNAHENIKNRKPKGMSVSAKAENINGGKTIYGTVTDGAKIPLPGVTISIEGSAKGAISDFDGNFTIQAKKGDVLMFQYIGLPSLKFKVTDEKKYQILARE